MHVWESTVTRQWVTVLKSDTLYLESCFMSLRREIHSVSVGSRYLWRFSSLLLFLALSRKKERKETETERRQQTQHNKLSIMSKKNSSASEGTFVVIFHVQQHAQATSVAVGPPACSTLVAVWLRKCRLWADVLQHTRLWDAASCILNRSTTFSAAHVDSQSPWKSVCAWVRDSFKFCCSNLHDCVKYW